MGNCCSSDTGEQTLPETKFSGNPTQGKKLLNSNLGSNTEKPKATFEESNNGDKFKTRVECKVCVIPVVFGKDFTNQSSFVRDTVKVADEDDEKYEFVFDIWTKKTPFVERTNPLSSFDAFYKDVDVILIQADFADAWEAKKKNTFQMFNQFKMEHYKEIQNVLKLLPQISSQGHDSAPLVVFQKFNHQRSDYGEIESAKRFGPFCSGEKWHIDDVWEDGVNAETMETRQKFGWKKRLIEEKKGKQTQVKAEPKQEEK